ncbi:phosphoinositide 5-phosphatase [Sarracenia purpurea var. burkii]
MVGIFLTVWVKSDLRDDVRNMKVSCVGRGLMGYLGNKVVQLNFYRDLAIQRNVIIREVYNLVPVDLMNRVETNISITAEARVPKKSEERKYPNL